MRIVLCGSSRFYELFSEIEAVLSSSGHSVYNPFNKEIGILSDESCIIPKVCLYHLHEILLSDAVVIINPNNYLGRTTQDIMLTSRKLHKKSFFYSGGPNWSCLMR